MKKKMIVLLLVMALLLTACGSKGTDATEPEPQGSVAEETASNNMVNDGLLTLGTVEGNTYQNEALGYGCTLEGWTFADSNRLAELNHVAAENVDANLLEQIAASDTFMDMYAESADRLANVNVNVENIAREGFGDYSEKDYCDAAFPQMAEAMNQMGASDVNVQQSTVYLGWDEHPGMIMTSTIQGVPVFQKQACVKFGDYMASITVTTYNEDNTDSILSLFYKLGE